MTNAELLESLVTIRTDVRKRMQERAAHWPPIPGQRHVDASVANLAAYLALREHDLRALQDELAMRGLSSLGQIESHVLETLDALVYTMAMLTGTPPPVHLPDPSDFQTGRRLLIENTSQLFGPTSSSVITRIMVTVPSDVVDEPTFFRELLRRGVHCLRINCAHDDPTVWHRMVQHIRSAEDAEGRKCTILMDLAGPKVRTANVYCMAGRERVLPGDRIHLLRPGAQFTNEAACSVECALPEIIDQLEIGAELWIDDGSVATTVEHRTDTGLMLRVTRAPLKGKKIKEAQGINTPNTDLHLDPLTSEDLAALDHVVQLADIVGYSFVQTAADIDRLHAEIDARTNKPISLIAKIETRHAVKNLPDIIVHGMARRPLGVMIARGDLAVELGFERITEMQEEIMWLCEAAHVPVIWATQVLESYVKTGFPTRAEMTDAAMSSRAECVMLNKGPFIAEAITVLDHVLARMAMHIDKKVPRLRQLHSW